jgi:4-hydroxy-tetrahydrodipicolinate reductase
MGQTVCAAVEAAPDMELVGRADPLLDASVEQVLAAGRPEVMVDFTRPDTAVENALACVRAGVHVVIGTTGFDIEELAAQAREIEVTRGGGIESLPPPDTRGEEVGERRANILIAPNFAIGAVLMMRFAAEASKHMAKAEIVELHREGKLDAPSGTAARTARLMAEAGGGEPPPIHSVRLPGIVANQEVILGDVGQTLTIRHDTTGRDSFMPGVLLAIRGVGALASTPVVGLEHLLFEGA